MDFARRLRHPRLWLFGSALVLLIGLLTLLFVQPDYYQAEATEKRQTEELAPAAIRLPGSNQVEVAVAVAQNIYPGTFKDAKPGAVILVPQGDWRTALLAMQIVHFPINAPLLYTERDSIPELTKAELKRLDPEGLFLDGNIKVILIGDIGEGVKQELRSEKLKFRELNADTPEELAALLDDYKAMFHVNHDDQVIIVPKNRPEYALLATSWVAHMGHTILLVGQDGVPEATRQALAKRPQDAFMYLIGDDEAIPPTVTSELAWYGHVQRIPGQTPAEAAIGFAAYQDFGRNFGYWFRNVPRTFGWAIGEAGHNFIFVNPAYPEMAIPAAALSHMGKHGPFLIVGQDQVPEAVTRYLKTVQPGFVSSQEPLFNHGWVIGDQDVISSEVLHTVDELLQVRR